MDASGIAVRSVLIRYLVMPGMLDETEVILKWRVKKLGPETCINAVDPYLPAGSVGEGGFR